MALFRSRVCAVLALCTTTAIALPAQTFTTLYSFCAETGCADGQSPGASLVQATDGNLYGTTRSGGANGDGAVFRISPSGTLTTLYSFCSLAGCVDGESPDAGLVQATNGDLYGTAGSGGAKGFGTVFRITLAGSLSTLHSFCSQSGCADGDSPYGGLVQASNGYLYGTTSFGGAHGEGTIFRTTPGGTLTTVYNFCSQSKCADGFDPSGVLVQGTNGDLYGTTQAGGASKGKGTVFQITPSGALTSFYSFCANESYPYGCEDGYQPWAGPIQGLDGNLYGTTNAGGSANLAGTVYQLTPSGMLTTLHIFCALAECADGNFPFAGLVQGTDGNLYGTTSGGGAYASYGTVFQITPQGTLTTLYSFCAESGCADGAVPFGGLIQDTNGTFYGTTLADGAYGGGTVFSVSVGLRPFVETQTASGNVGAVVKILGTDLTGATSVTFNGTAADFDVVSSSLIAATVPAGATTGTVQVVTPSGTLASNVPFRVP